MKIHIKCPVPGHGGVLIHSFVYPSRFYSSNTLKLLQGLEEKFIIVQMSIGGKSEKLEKKLRVFNITDETFKVLCQADKKNFDPTVGLENIVAMYLALVGPINFDELEKTIATHKAVNLFKEC